MKKFGLSIIGAAACVALAAILGWSALPATADAGTAPSKNFSGGTCPMKAAANASCMQAKGASHAKAEAGTCNKAAANAVNKDGAKPSAMLAAGKTGQCPIANAAAASGCCASGAAKSVAEKDCPLEAGACDSKNVAKLVMTDSRFTTLALAVKAAGMEDELTCPDPKTVLAPTNEAFQKIPASQWAAILQDDAKLKALVSNHIIKGAAMKSTCLTDAKTAKSAGGGELAVSQCPVTGKVSVNNAGIVGDAMVANNGNVLAIDNVLMPADMQLAKAEAGTPVHIADAK